MPNLKSLKALKKLMQEQGLLKQVEKMATTPDKYGIVSGDAINALEATQNRGLASSVVKNELRHARRDGLRQDAIRELQDKFMLKPDLTDHINAIGNEDRWLRAGGPKGERSLGATESYGGIPSKYPEDLPHNWEKIRALFEKNKSSE